MLQSLFRRKLLLLAIILAVSGAFYYIYKSRNELLPIQYVTSEVTKGTLTVAVSGTGQVSSSNQVEIKTEASGKIIKLPIKNGQEVKSGEVLAQLDASEALKAVRDAEVNLSSARLSLEKLQKPADALSILQAENSLESARVSLEKLKLTQQTEYDQTLNNREKSEDAVIKDYEDAFNAIANAFLNLPTIITKLQDTLYSTEISQAEPSAGGNVWNLGALLNTTHSDFRDKIQTFITTAENDYKTARAKYDQNFTDYKNASRYSSQAVIELLLSETLETTKSMAQAAKSESNMFDAWVDYRTQKNAVIFSAVKTYQTNLSTYISQTNTHLSSLLTAQNSLRDDKDAVENALRDLQEMEKNNPLDLAAAEQSIKEKEASLADLKAGADALDVKAQQLSIQQKQNALLDAREKLADYTIRAPLSGIITNIDARVGDNASSGTALATLVTKQQIAEISLNEVDAAKVAVGQKVILTFDAIDGLSLTGEVAEVDTLGTVSQGVVSYTAKVTFDAQDERVKAGMSVSAAIITDIKQDVLIVPSSAVKSQGENYYVEAFDSGVIAAQNDLPFSSATPPRQQSVGIGISNDTDTEIISGLEEGDRIVTRTITATTSANTSSAPSATSLFGGNRAGGGGGIPRN